MTIDSIVWAQYVNVTDTHTQRVTKRDRETATLAWRSRDLSLGFGFGLGAQSLGLETSYLAQQYEKLYCLGDSKSYVKCQGLSSKYLTASD